MSPNPAALERTASLSERRPSAFRPTLPSLASWTSHGTYTAPSALAREPPTSASSTSSVESEPVLTPSDVALFPPPPKSLKMPSPNLHLDGGFSPTNRTQLSSFRVQDIPPFRGAQPGSFRDRSSSTASRPATSAGTSSIQTLSSVPSVLAQPDPSSSRRASVASVFSLPNPNTSSAPFASSSRPPAPTMGLGIAGVGVGSGGAKEALVIERLGESSRDGRRGSLKRVLMSSDDEEQTDMLRVSTSSRDSTRSRMDGEAGVPLPLQRPPSRHDLPPSSLNPAAHPRTGSSSPPQPSVQGGRASPSSSKRPRTARLSPLESLAHTASNLLAGPSMSSSSTASSSGSTAAKEPRLSSSTGKARAAAHDGDVKPNASGLAKRRGHRPPAVSVAGASSSSAVTASARVHPYHAGERGDAYPPLRSAPVDAIPSVLVGSPVDPNFASRAGRDLPPMRGGAAGSMRRASRSGGVSGGAFDPRDERERDRPYPSVVTQQPLPPLSAREHRGGDGQQNQPPLVSSSTYYIRPNQPLGPGVPFPSSASTPTTTGPPPSSKALPPPPPSAHRLPPMSARGNSPQQIYRDHPSSSSHRHHPQSAHPFSAHYSQQQQQHSQPSQRPHGSPSYPSSAALPPHASTSSSSAAAGAVPPTPSASASSAAAANSKQAFLSLFSTFYDSLSDSRVLTSTLEGQISRASALLHTLQSAESVLERLVDERVGRYERTMDERTRGWEGRLRGLEERVFAGSGASSSFSAQQLGAGTREDGEPEPKRRRGSGESHLSASSSSAAAAAAAVRPGSSAGVEDRLERLEKALEGRELREREASAGGSGSRPSTGMSGAPSVSTPAGAAEEAPVVPAKEGEGEEAFRAEDEEMHPAEAVEQPVEA
ncbi:hypothetical protein JCM8097_001103 [Rhodosporidiobolus ruineniae]